MNAVQFKSVLQQRLLERRRAKGATALEEQLDALVGLGGDLVSTHKIPPHLVEHVHMQIILELRTFGPLAEMLHDERITEIEVNGPDRIFVERGGRKQPAGLRLRSEEQLRHIVEQVMELDPTVRLDQSSPMANVATSEGYRINLCIPPVVLGGPHMTIRKFLTSFATIQDFVAAGTCDQPMAAFLKACAAGHVALLMSGGTGTGKTTLIDLLAKAVDPTERIVVIEDTPELRLTQPNAVRMVTRGPNVEGKGEIGIGDLFRNCLRMSPDRIILGEIRGGEAYDYLQALNSGHAGSFAVIHANSPEEALVRLENLVPLAGLGVPAAVVRRQIGHGLEVVVQMQRYADGSRKISRISEVIATDDERALEVKDIFRFVQEGIVEGKVVGRFVATGHTPEFLDRIALRGVKLNPAVFLTAA